MDKERFPVKVRKGRYVVVSHHGQQLQVVLVHGIHQALRNAEVVDVVRYHAGHVIGHVPILQIRDHDGHQQDHGNGQNGEDHLHS